MASYKKPVINKLKKKKLNKLPKLVKGSNRAWRTAIKKRQEINAYNRAVEQEKTFRISQRDRLKSAS